MRHLLIHGLSLLQVGVKLKLKRQLVKEVPYEHNFQVNQANLLCYTGITQEIA